MTSHLDGSLAKVLWETEHQMHRDIEGRLAVVRLTLPQFFALALLVEQPQPAAALARRLPITPQAVSSLVTRLEACGYLTRTQAEGRNQTLAPSEEGRAAFEQATALFAEEEERFFGSLVPEQRRRLCDELGRCREPSKPAVGW